MESENDKDDPTSGLEFGGGVFRSILRRIGHLAGKTSIGQLPHKLPLKQVVKSAERLGDLIEIGDQIGKSGNKKNSYTTHGPSHDESNKPNNSRLARSIVHGAHAMSGFVKSSVLGGVLFYTYDNLQDILKLASANGGIGHVSTVWVGASASIVGAIGNYIDSSFFFTPFPSNNASHLSTPLVRRAGPCDHITHLGRPVSPNDPDLAHNDTPSAIYPQHTSHSTPTTHQCDITLGYHTPCDDQV